MRKLLTSVAIILSAIGVLSCEGVSPVTPADPQPETPQESPILFSKATISDAYGMTNGEVGLSIGNPVNVNNVKVIVDAEGNISCATPLYWGLEQTAASNFTAYYPYNAAYSDTTEVTFSVNTDQSQEGNFHTSRLLFASAKAKPSDSAVSLVFNDRMAGLDIWFDNRSGKTIKDVRVVNILGSVVFNLSSGNCSTIAASPVEIKMLDALPGQTPEGLSHYCAILPPQRTELVLNVEFSDGTSQLCSPQEPVNLEAKLYHTKDSPIILGEISQGAIDFSLSVRDWNYGGGLVFGKDTTPPCEFECALYLYSERWEGDDFDDYTHLIYYLKGEDLAHMSVAIIPSSDYLTVSKTLSNEEITLRYGFSLDNDIDNLAKGIFYAHSGLKPGVEYTLVVAAENTSGAKATATCTKSTLPYPETDIVPGAYTLTYESFSHTLNLAPTSEKNVYKITNLGDIDDIPFKAVYDKAESTLTLDGIGIGYETYGSLFGWGLYEYDTENNIRYISTATESSTAIDDPLVFKIDKNGHISGLVNYIFGTEVYNRTDGNILGYFVLYSGPETSIVYGTPSKAVRMEPLRLDRKGSHRSFPKVQPIR